MTDRDFVYWLQGFFEVQNPTTIDEEKTRMIKDHLDLVFNHVLPNKNGGYPGKQIVENPDGSLGILYKGHVEPHGGVYGNYGADKIKEYEDKRKGYSNETTDYAKFEPSSGYSC